MPISAAGNSRRRPGERGFTLVELMVVVTVIGLASGVALWSLPDPRGRVVEEATRLAARTRAARDLAIIDSRPVSLWMTGGGYGFDQRIGGRWVPLADKPFRVASWAEGTVAQLAQPQLRVTFDPTGLADRPAEVRLDRDGRGAAVTIGGDGSVAVDG
jgi:general secretion pathway protein H